MKKTVHIEGLHVPIVIARRKGTRSIKLAVTSHGSVRLTVPYGVPEFTAIAFAKRKADWIVKHAKKPDLLSSGSHIGKSHTLVVSQADISRPNTKITNLDIRVRLPLNLPLETSEAQTVIRRACEKALLAQGESLLPQRIATLSKLHGIPYASVSVKKLKSRWGACDNHGNISLSIYLMQLPWSLIDYVICHELAHTIHHNHSTKFWETVAVMLPDYKNQRTELKSKPTDIITT